jgi:hypothetical protein
MSTLRTCPACATNFIWGRKALVLGVMRLVCLSCSEGAMRMVTTVKNAKCQEKHCNEEERLLFLAMIRGMRNVLEKLALGEHAQGKA